MHTNVVVQDRQFSGDQHRFEFSPNLRYGIAIAFFVLSGCASVPADFGRGDVDALVTDRGQAVEAGTETLLASLTGAPLTAENAVRIALMNNPRLQSTYATLGFGAADIYEAGRIRNPVFSGTFLDSGVAGERDLVTLGLATSFTDLITLPARKRLSGGAFAALKQSVGAEVLAVAAETETAYYHYVGAQQVATLRAQIAKASALSAALAERFSDAGNLAPRELALERAAASAARLAALEVEADAFGARTELATMLGLSVGGSWSAPAALRLPPATEDDLDALIALAMDARLDLAAARTRTDVLADQLGVVNWTRWLGELNAGIERERETDGAKLTGPFVEWEVPIFNQHKGALMRANSELQIAINEVREITIYVDNSVRLAYANLLNSRARITEYRTALIPHRVETVARAQEQVNFMLIGIFELIVFKQDEYDAYQGYLEAIQDYWIARVGLTLATGRALPSSGRISDERVDVEDFVRPAAGGMNHTGHSGMQNGMQMAPDENGMQEQMDYSGSGGMQNDMQMTPNGSGMNESMDHSQHQMPRSAPNESGASEPGGATDHTGHNMQSVPGVPAGSDDAGAMDHADSDMSKSGTDTSSDPASKPPVNSAGEPSGDEQHNHGSSL